MPVVLRSKGYKFRFYEAYLDEAPHIHVAKSGTTAHNKVQLVFALYMWSEAKLSYRLCDCPAIPKTRVIRWL